MNDSITRVHYLDEICGVWEVDSTLVDADAYTPKTNILLRYLVLEAICSLLSALVLLNLQTTRLMVCGELSNYSVKICIKSSDIIISLSSLPLSFFFSLYTMS